MDTAQKISEIVEQRNNSVKPLQKEEERCVAALDALDKLQKDLTVFIKSRDRNEPTVATCVTLNENIPRIRQQIHSLQAKINHCRRRFDRPTINIGFGGKRGQGKSFLLQKFSGLSDDEVPSGSGKTVTAVRSEIFNDRDAYAEITFYQPEEFLREVIAPYCAQLDIAAPSTLEEFQEMKLPAQGEVNELQVSYLAKLNDLRNHLHEYESLLDGSVKVERDFSQLRKYVAYTDKNNKDTFTYAAVKRVMVHTPFPETNVKQLGLVDLPGLGELNPTVETRHTAGFGDEVDLVMLIRRPFGTRVDWDNEDHKAMETLKSAIKDGDLPGFVVIVQNEGGCDPEMANTALESITANLSDKFMILRSAGNNSIVLTADVLAPVLDHLAHTLPGKDRKILDEIENGAQNLWTGLGNYSQKALGQLKKLNDRGFPGEEVRAKARENRELLARKLEDTSKILDERVTSNAENEELNDSIEGIQKSLREFIKNGMGTGSPDEWVRKNANKIAVSKNVSPIYTENAHTLRVQIAEEFAALNQSYEAIVDELLDLVASQLEEVLPNFLKGDSGRQKLTYLRDRLANGDISFDNIVEALNFLLNFRIEHRTQMYPRAYQPIRNFMKIAANPQILQDTDSKSREEQAADVFDDLSGRAQKVIMDVGDLLLEESQELNNMLYVALQFFDDKIIRSQNAELHWERFIESFYPEIYGSSADASQSVAIGAIMDKLSRLNKAVQ